jgi:hypothetical protein
MEMELVRTQFSKGASIFDCDDWEIFSDRPTFMNPGQVQNSVIPPPVPEDPTGAAPFSVEVYLRVWRQIADSRRYRDHDWTVKADPDTVFLPARLRQRLGSRQGDHEESMYFRDCWEPFAVPPHSVLNGPLEILSRPAVESLAMGTRRCLEAIETSSLSEGNYIQLCMDHLGIKSVEDFTLIKDEDCSTPGVPLSCASDHEVAFHSFDQSTSYFHCLADTSRSSSGRSGGGEHH